MLVFASMLYVIPLSSQTVYVCVKISLYVWCGLQELTVMCCCCSVKLRIIFIYKFISELFCSPSDFFFDCFSAFYKLLLKFILKFSFFINNNALKKLEKRISVMKGRKISLGFLQNWWEFMRLNCEFFYGWWKLYDKLILVNLIFQQYILRMHHDGWKFHLIELLSAIFCIYTS